MRRLPAAVVLLSITYTSCTIMMCLQSLLTAARCTYIVVCQGFCMNSLLKSELQGLHANHRTTAVKQALPVLSQVAAALFAL